LAKFCALKEFDLPPELRLILSCLRLTPKEKEVQRIAELSSAKIGWPEFLKWVDRHRVAPLVYQNLRRYGGKRVPASVMSALRSRFERNARRGLANAAELVRLYKLFQEHGISVLPLKGSVSALQVYGNLALRHAGDIDLLVEPSQLELADLLLQMSYRRTVPARRLTPSKRRRFLRIMHHFEYQHDQGSLRVELHWRAIHNQPASIMDLTQMWSRDSAVVLAGSRLPALLLPENVLYLCGHGGVHFWHRLFWLVDLAEIIRGNPEIDWQQLLASASETGLRRPLASGAILAQELLDIPMPEAIRGYAAQDQLVSHSVQIAYKYMLCPQPENPPISLALKRDVYLLRSANSFEERLNTLLEIWARNYLETQPLPDSLFLLYGVIRFPGWLQRKLCGSRT
jgi:Uncharacterised nucleotidyltransferase